jgi:hypothetical protein
VNVLSPLLANQAVAFAKDVALHLDLAQLAPQLDELLAFLGVQGCHVDRQPRGTSSTSFTYPAQDAGDVAAKFFGQIAGTATAAHQFDHLVAKTLVNRAASF